MQSLFKDGLTLGLSTLVAAKILQWGYKTTGYYPPDSVFYFFSGLGGFLLIEAVEHSLNFELLSCDEGHRLT